MADFGYGGSPGTYLYGDDNSAYRNFANLSQAQVGQSLNAGERAAQLSDPYAEQRKRDIESLRLLTSNPGSITTSPFYQFLRDEQLNAVQSRNAATGNFRSGRGAMALQDRAAGVATQSYFPLLNNLTQRAISGSSPTAAGVTYERGVRASQDQAQLAAAARAAGQQRPPTPDRGGISPAQDMMNRLPAQPSYTPAGTSSFGLPYSGAVDDPLQAGWINTANGPMRYTPTADSGTGYVISDYGVSGVNGAASDYYPIPQPTSQPAQQQPTYEPYQSEEDSYDFGMGGWEE